MPLDEILYPEPDPNKRPSADVWNERYNSEKYLFGEDPIILLQTFSKVLKTGKALDVAMGEGRNAVFLAQCGFSVEGMDVSSKAIEKANSLAQKKKIKNYSFKVQNLDFFLMPLMKYDTILMTYFRPVKRFFNEIRRGLVFGGTLLMEAFTVEHYKMVMDKPNNIVDYEDCYRSNELLFLLKDFQILYYKELPEGNSNLVQVIARKNKA